MKKYFVQEEAGKDQSALSKARQDVSSILSKNHWTALDIHRKKSLQSKIVHYIRMMFWTNLDWIKIGNRIERDSVMLVQFPFLNSLVFNKVAAWYIARLKKQKNVKVILLIHDIDSIRFPQETTKQYSHEKVFWGLSDVIIAHNDRMKEYLLEQSVKSHIVTLQVFDYIGNSTAVTDERRDGSVVIAGNLDGNKAGYLRKLKEIKDCDFSLYGPGFEKQMEADNVIYRGVYPSDQLAAHIRGSWGLVWDGVSTNACTGAYGEYLRYNNPHKVSLYISLGLPVIIWKEAAEASFIEENKIGITIDSLDELGKRLKNISVEKYVEIEENIKHISSKLCSGGYLSDAVEESLRYLEK